VAIQVSVFDAKRTIFKGAAGSVFLPGDEGEFEILPMHKPVLSLLKAGEIIMDGKRSIAVKKGVVRFENDTLVALVEL
jgi:F0F1-type ATP synthase epsilon subunit